jgi:hypothetical protein
LAVRRPDIAQQVGTRKYEQDSRRQVFRMRITAGMTRALAPVASRVAPARGLRRITALVSLLAAPLVGCAGDRGKPAESAGTGDDAIVAAPEAARSSGADATPRDATAPGAREADTEGEEQEASGRARTAGAARELDTELMPSVVARDGTPLPQTHDRPRADSAGLRLRLELLVAAIVEDDPERAVPAFFPKVAYEQVKAIERPGRDWQYRLVRAFERNIHEYHLALGTAAAGARFAGLTLREPAVRWMAPGSEGNRVGYYRVTRAQLRLRFASGAERKLELTSLISWRGAWYVVHLHGFS